MIQPAVTIIDTSMADDNATKRNKTEENIVLCRNNETMDSIDDQKQDDKGIDSDTPKVADSLADHTTVFKKPIIMPKMTVKKTSTTNVLLEESERKKTEQNTPVAVKKEENSETIAKPQTYKSSGLSPAEILKQKEIPIGYKEPEWSGVAEQLYSFEVVKNGTVIDNVGLSTKPFYVFGRLPSCDCQLEHPSLSRYHAVIQYCKVKTENHGIGWYLYDLDSTHGTWMNKIKVKSRVYNRIRVGYVIKFGGSTRLHILQVIYKMIKT